MSERENEMKTAEQLTENDHCETCKNTGLMICPSHMTRKNEYGDCFWCDGEEPEQVTCECQDQ